MWSAEKALSNLITNVIISKKFEQFQIFQDEINAKYAHFLDILKDAPPALTEREKVKRGNEGDGIYVNYLRAHKKLSQSLIEEALTLSDLFGLSEMAAVELLIEAEEQMQYFHGFNRGLTAVLLYYDTKKLAVNNLKTLIVARSGRTWILDENMPGDVVKFIDDFVARLLQNGLISKILTQIGLNDWQKAEESLNRVNGLGNLKHRKQVKNLFEEIKVTMAECVFDCACQVPFNMKDTLAVIQFLKSNCHLEPVSSPASAKTSPIQNSHLYLIMSLLYSFDSSFFDTKDRAEINKIADKFLKESEFIKTVYKELEQIKHENGEWVTPGVKATLQFAYHMFINGINGFIMDNELSEDASWKATGVMGFSDDETLIDAAIHLHVFSFLRTVIVQHEKFHQEVLKIFVNSSYLMIFILLF